MTLIELLNAAEAQLKKTGIASPRLDAEVLFAHVLGVSRADLYLRRDERPDSTAAARFQELVRRRADRCPVAYLTGEKEFWSRRLRVTPDVLIPRPETELVVEVALRLLKTRDARHETRGKPAILDICSGSGCIAAALAAELPQAHMTVADISPAALDVARENLTFAADRVDVIVSDLFESLRGTPSSHESRVTSHGCFDLITANPPYIPSGDIDALDPDISRFEPRTALDGGKQGLDFASRIIEDAPRFLRSGGWLVMEMGIGQADELTALARRAGHSEIAIASDLAGIPRVISARRPCDSPMER